jgi:CubicO group peptidase (beta-lactamase class C family)
MKTSVRLAARLDAIFEEWNRPDSPGCSVGVSRHGVIEYERAFGLANLEWQIPIAPDSVFHVASIAKQFTAMSLLLLEQRGLLAIDAPARTYITELPEYAQPLTIRHLLTHTSGLRDAFLLFQLAPPREDGVGPNDAVVRMLAQQRALNFLPGTDWQYNNAAYTLLGEIVKRVSGQSLATFAKAHIFEPLGMTQTHVHADPTGIVPRRVSGYMRGPNGFRLALRADPGGLLGNSGLFTTTRDLLRWEQNFADPRVGGVEAIAAMQAPMVQTATGAYGLGLDIARHRGLTTIGHGGSDPGFSAYVVRYPDQDVAIAVLCNVEEVDVQSLATRIADLALAPSFPAAATVAVSPVTLSREQLTTKAGVYRDLTGELFGRLFVRDGQLLSSPGVGTDPSVALIPVSADRFLIPGTSVAFEFVPAAGDRPLECHIVGAGPTRIVMQQIVTPFAPTATELQAMAGVYASAELNATYTVIARDADLMLRISGRSDIVLHPLFPDAFHDGIVGVLEFTRDGQGAIDGFTIHRPEVRSLQVARAPTACP